MNKKLMVKAASFCVFGLLSTGVLAESVNGSLVLEQEAARAKELQDLKYQAQLIEQRAKIAKAYQDLNGAGGYVPTNDGTVVGGGERVDGVSESVVSTGDDKKKDKFKLPVLNRVNGSVASFSTKQGHAEAKEGGFLPGGYRVLTVSSVEGVKLMRKGIIYQVGLSWDQPKK